MILILYLFRMVILSIDFPLKTLKYPVYLGGTTPFFQPWAWPTSLDLLELPPRPEEAVRCVDLFEETFLGVWLWWPKKSGDAAVCVVVCSLALACPPAELIPKSFSSAVFCRFWGSKKDDKITRCFLEAMLGTFCCFFGACQEPKHSVFVPLAWKKYFLQHGENCVNTNVFAGHWPKNTVTTMMFATRGKKKQGKYRGFGFPRRKEHRYLRVTKMWKHNLFDDCRPLRDWEKNCRSDDDDDDDDDNNDDDDDDDDNNNNKKKKKKHKNATKKCVVRWLQAAVWKEHHTVLCTCAHAQSTWTTPTLTLLYITLMASPVCKALQYEVSLPEKCEMLDV